jgi:hypothetical protein
MPIQVKITQYHCSNKIKPSSVLGVFLVLAVLRFELAKQALYHLGHAFSFAMVIF